ncbi:MAG TPA: VWA domain-containing protein [Sandaracinaceae bacterium LLY-WYZ-13_1]|nr:VWA domain-containing protein [Sandaracinaceae bacterium LLY-WYZ-13_1]
MTWQHDGLLWLLAAVPLVAALPVAAWLLRRRATRRFGDPSVARLLTAGRSGPWRATRAVLFVVAVAFAVVALAGPQYGSRTRILRRRGVDVVVALDFSKSMLARDVRPSRIERAKAELTRMIGEMEGDRVGVVAFAGEAMEFPMTTDYRALSLFFRDLGPYDMPVGGTAIARALVASKRLMERADTSSANMPEEERRSRVVILMTDGEDHEGDPVEAARELADAGVRVFTVGIGSRTGEPIPTYAPDGTWTGYLRDQDGEVVTSALTEENERQLREIAEATNGHYFRAPRGQVGVDQIRAELRRMDQHENESRRVTVHEARYALALLPAFLLLLLEALLPEAWIGRRKPTAPPATRRERRGRRRS